MDIGDKKNEIGDLTDLVGVPYSYGNNSILAFLLTGYYHVHGTSFVYPDHASNVVLTSSAASWSETGSIVEVIPADGITPHAFDLHWINISAISGNSEIQVDIFSGASGSEVRIGATRSQRNTNQSRENANRIQIPQQVAGTRISCRLSSSAASEITCAVSFEGHLYTG